MIGCSKENDEPSGGGNNNHETENSGTGSGGNAGQSLNDKTYNWISVFSEQTLVKDGVAPVSNTSKECLEWKSKYEKYFTFQDVGVLRYYSWTTTFDYTFAEMDAFASEYVGFTLGENLSPEGYDWYTATLENYWYVDPVTYNFSGYILYYTYDSSLETESISDNWVAYYCSDNYGSYDGISKEFEEWAEAHKDYLTSEEPVGNGYKRIWTIPLKYFDNEYIMEEVYPFISLDATGNQLTVNVHKKNDGINREFYYMSSILY